MVLKVKVNKKAILSRWRIALLNEHVDQARERAIEVEKYWTDLLNETRISGHQDRAGGGRFAPLLSATPKVTTTVTAVANRGVKLKVHVVMNEGSSPHKEWHILQFGRSAFTQENQSPLIFEYSGFVTKQGLPPNAGGVSISPNVFFIPAGTLVASIPPRRWYEAVRERTRRVLLRRVSFTGSSRTGFVTFETDKFEVKGGRFF